jgi:hypothetical protein
MIRFSLDLAFFRNRLKSTPNPDGVTGSFGRHWRWPHLPRRRTLPPLARSWRGPRKGCHADAHACVLKMKGVAAFVLQSEMPDGDVVRSEDVASAITTMSSGGEGGAAMAMTGSRPAQTIALTCARKL